MNTPANDNMKATITIYDRNFAEYRKNRSLREYESSARVYFSHQGETFFENLAARHSRPVDLYRSFLPQVAKELGLPPTTRFRWSQKAGCQCGCSPGFICSGVRRKDVRVEISTTFPTTSRSEEAQTILAQRKKAIGLEK